MNVSRPAASIIKRLVEADPRFAPPEGVSAGQPGTKGNQASAGGKSGHKLAPLQVKPGAKVQSGIWGYGFDVVFDEMKAQAARKPEESGSGPPGRIPVLETVVRRLSSGDSMMAMDRYAYVVTVKSIANAMKHSMLLINSLLKNATDTRWEELTFELERLNTRKAVIVSTQLSSIPHAAQRYL